jgi:hypothetical protein
MVRAQARPRRETPQDLLAALVFHVEVHAAPVFCALKRDSRIGLRISRRLPSTQATRTQGHGCG